MDHKFQINLRGIIDLLSEHLYSGPEVFVRELLQNATDAIRAQQKNDRSHVGDVRLELHQPENVPPTLVISDNGIGLTTDEVHQFLATIGMSSKRAAEGERPNDFIGQFGIGILSCFVVSDSIIVYSQSRKPDSPPVEWKAKPDGTYTLKNVERELQPGTQVWLTAKPEHADYFTFEKIQELTWNFGGLLPFPITLTSQKQNVVVNEQGAPWRHEYSDKKQRAEAYRDFGRTLFGMEFLATIPLKSEVGEVEGIAYVLPHSASMAARRTHRVYLKNMLLSETADNLLPDWAFFVKAVVNANDLRPTASRESFYEDDNLAAARSALGESLRKWLLNLAQKNPRKLDRILSLHALAIKGLAVEDDEFYRMVIDLLPFETSRGTMSFAEYREQNDTIRYAQTVDQFRQMSQVAQAHGLTIINGGYTHDTNLMLRAEELLDLPVEEVEASSFSQTFDDLDDDELVQVAHFLNIAESVLQEFDCDAEIKNYRPTELPALFTTDREGRFLRNLEQTKEFANPLWSGVLDSISKSPKSSYSHAQLCFNYTNPLVRRLTEVRDRSILMRTVQMLYLQSLLLGHHPLSAKEMKLLNDGLLSLIEWGIGLNPETGT